MALIGRTTTKTTSAEEEDDECAARCLLCVSKRSNWPADAILGAPDELECSVSIPHSKNQTSSFFLFF